MKRFIFCFLSSFCSLLANEKTIESYLEYFSKYPEVFGPNGDFLQGEIQIVKDKNLMLEIEKNLQREVGLIHEDFYWLWVNDAVIFPSGKKGVYGRILWRSSLTGVAGVAVLPLFKDNKIALNVNYRHATRSFELEMPRGMREKNETPEEAAKRELQEETGYLVDHLHFLGEMNADSGLTNTKSPIYLGLIEKQISHSREDSEAIDSIAVFSLEELNEAISKGYIEMVIQNQKQNVYIRDSFLLFALYQAKIKNLL